MANLENKVVFDCEVQKKVFTNKENGDVIEYYSLTLKIGEEEIKVTCSADSKKLFNYLVKPYFE